MSEPNLITRFRPISTQARSKAGGATKPARWLRGRCTLLPRDWLRGSPRDDPSPHSGGGLAMSDESILARVRRDATAAADERWRAHTAQLELLGREEAYQRGWQDAFGGAPSRLRWRSEEHTSELQSLMRNSYA